MKKKTIILIISIFCVIFLASNYWQPTDNITIKKTKYSTLADYYFEKVKVIQFDQNGQLASQIKADKMEHFKADNSSNLFSPQVSFISKKNATWQLSSNQGTFSHHSNQLKLNGQVLITETVNTKNTLITTQNLMLDLNHKSASNDEQVEIKTDHSLTKAIGILADFKQDQIHLKAQVQSKWQTNDS